MRDMIDMMCAAQDLAAAGRDPLKQRAAYGDLTRVLERTIEPRANLYQLPLRNLELLAWSIQKFYLRAPAAGPGPGPEVPSKTSRTLLKKPAFKYALIMREPVDKILAMDFNEFVEAQKVMNAAWAEMQLDLVNIVSMPHFEDKTRRRKFEDLRERIESLQPADLSPWHQHRRETAKRLGMAG